MVKRNRGQAGIFILVCFLAILLGWAIGSFFTGRQFARSIAKLPGSPIVLNARFDKKSHSVIYSILNPGGTPLTIVEESLIFTPGKLSKQPAYIISSIPANQIIPPQKVVEVKVNLKAGTEDLKLGDVVLVTFTYTHPLSKDVYTVVHKFIMGMSKSTKSQKKANSTVKNK